jgi:glycerol-3-phosphate acyltransferase PlsY
VTLPAHAALGVVAACLVGSIPTAYLAGKAKGVDLRTVGSGNLGATNAWRVFGWKVGLSVYLIDTLKGTLPVWLLPRWLALPTAQVELWSIVFGAAAIAGHVRPVFLGFRRGGKGVATGGGVFFALAPAALLVAFAVFAVTFLASGYVSLGSLVAAAALPVAVLLTRGAGSLVFPASLAIAAFVFWTHRANIGRLRRGEENRFRVGRGRRGETPTTEMTPAVAPSAEVPPTEVPPTEVPPAEAPPSASRTTGFAR